MNVELAVPRPVVHAESTSNAALDGLQRDAVNASALVMVTLGTGIGTAVFSDGILVANAEFGHLVIAGAEAKEFVSGRAKGRRGSTWEHRTHHMELFLRDIERLVWPDLFVIGGGINAEFRLFCAALDTLTSAIAAALGNDAGIRQRRIGRGGPMTDELAPGCST